MTVFHPVQTQNQRNALPETVVLRADEVYCALYGAQPAMVDVKTGCRGGFGIGEILAFLYARSFTRKEWQERFDEALERRPWQERQ